MALDFYKLDNDEFLFALDDTHFNYLRDVFRMFAQWTGIIIDPYQRLILSIENQKTLIQVIDKYMRTTDLNTNKKKTSAIFEFKGLLF